jgi:ATP-dependent exoDNAse (exonuclease V) alpha subunit
MVVLAPTGVAALNVSGQTIHSFFGFPPRLMQSGDIRRKRFNRLYELLDTIVIDEVSMVRADMMDHIDFFLRLNRDDPRPFGGVQMLFFGDLFQLPPVVATPVEKQLFETEYASPYFFDAHVIQEGYPLEMIELSKVYRQENKQFLKLLDNIRLNRIDFDDLMELNERHLPDFQPDGEGYLTLSARNAQVDRINQAELAANPAPSRNYLAEVKGNFPAHLYPTDAALALKLNAQVMFLRNDPDKQYVNGTIGYIVKLDAESVIVKISENEVDREITVKPQEWEIAKYRVDPIGTQQIDTEKVGSFTQLPLRLAWAVTIHKAQGKTFDRVIIDLGRGAFEHGQTYVALSRCRTLEGIVLKQRLRQRDVMVDNRVVEYYTRLG